MPPYSSLALLHAEATKLTTAMEFLQQSKAIVENKLGNGIQMLGPMAATMTKKSGKYRAHILVHAIDKKILQKF